MDSVMILWTLMKEYHGVGAIHGTCDQCAVPSNTREAAGASGEEEQGGFLKKFFAEVFCRAFRGQIELMY